MSGANSSKAQALKDKNRLFESLFLSRRGFFLPSAVVVLRGGIIRRRDG